MMEMLNFTPEKGYSPTYLTDALNEIDELQRLGDIEELETGIRHSTDTEDDDFAVEEALSVSDDIYERLERLHFEDLDIESIS